MLVDAHVLNLGGMGVVLGVAWLQTLDKVLMDWRDMSMQFSWSGHPILLKGITSSDHKTKACSFDSSHSLYPLVASTVPTLDSLLCHMSDSVAIEDPSDLSSSQWSALDSLLTSHPGAFKELVGLPPRRSAEHCINLKEGSALVNVRPYKYPHHHKNEIERQVHDMLQQGIIRHNSSPFSSLFFSYKER